MEAALRLSRPLADRGGIWMLWMRELVLLFMVPDVDGPRRGIFTEWRFVGVAAVPGGPSGQSSWRTTGRPADAPLGSETGVALDSGNVPDADRVDTDCDGVVSRQGCGDRVVEPGIWNDGSNAAFSLGALPGDRSE